MAGRRGWIGDRRIVIRCHGHTSKAEIRQSILKQLLREYDAQKRDTGLETGRGSGSDAGGRE